MHPSFLLKLRVVEVKTPQDHEPTESPITVRLTLAHTVGDIKELILIRNPRIKRRSIQLQWLGASLNDSTTIASALGIDECPPFNNSIDALSVVIDWADAESNRLGSRDSVPDLFDVSIMIHDNNYERLLTYRETLFSTVKSLKDQACERLHWSPSEIVLKRADQHTQLHDSETLCDVLQLDVPPLQPVVFELSRKDALVIRVTDLRSQRTVPMPLTHKLSVHDLKRKISASFDSLPVNIIRLYHGAHLISDVLSTEEQQTIGEILAIDVNSVPPFLDMEFDTKDVLTTRINDEEWTPSGRNFTEIHQGEGQTRLVDVGELSSEVYEINVNGSVCELNSTDLLLNETEGYVLISPSGYHKMRGCFGSRLQHAPRAPGSTSRTTNSREETNEQEVPLLFQDDAHRTANQGDGNEAGAREQAERNRGVMSRFYHAIRDNGALLRQLGMSLLVVGIFGGYELLMVVSSTPEILAVMMALVAHYTLHVRGGDISNWLDEVILRDAPNRLDTRVVELISLYFRFLHRVYTKMLEEISGGVLNVWNMCTRQRSQVMAARVQGRDSVWFYFWGMLCEVFALVVVFFATIIPSAGEVVEARSLEIRGGEAEAVRKRVQEELQKHCRKVPALVVENALRELTGKTIDEVQAVDGEPEEILGAYYVVLKLCLMDKKQIEAIGLEASTRGNNGSNDTAARTTGTTTQNGGDEDQ